MNITRTSILSNITHSKVIPVNPEDYIMWQTYNVSIEDAMPYLTGEDKDFILSGITPNEWAGAWAQPELVD